LDQAQGTEPGEKTRAVLILQAQALLDAGHPSTLIVPLTTNLVDGAEPLRVRAGRAGRLRRAPDQLRAIDNRRLVQGPLARLPDTLMLEVGESVKEVLDLA